MKPLSSGILDSLKTASPLVIGIHSNRFLLRRRTDYLVRQLKVCGEILEDVGTNRVSWIKEMMREISLSPADRFAILVWSVATGLLLGLSFMFNIPYISTFALHSPAVGVVLLIVFLPMLLVTTEDQGEIPEQVDSGLGRVGLWILLAIVGLFLSFMVLLPWNLNPTILIFWFILPLLICLLIFKMPMKTLGFTGASIRNLMGTLVLALAYGMLVFVLIGFNEFAGAFSFIAPLDTDYFQLLPLAISYGIIFMVFMVAIPEEFMGRVLIQSPLTKKLGRVRGILVSSLIFGLFHIPTNYFILTAYFGSPAPIQALITSFLFQAQIGVILGVAWERSRSLALPVSLHALHNVAEMAPVFWLLALGFI
ncbi:MAG: CPBP family intramembrane glutamic endopeptidase [Candidatus Thorarchaeota archaeon]